MDKETNLLQEALKPCPWCRGTELRPPMQDIWQKWLIGCASCGAEGPQAQTPALAITWWNTRAPDPEARNTVLDEAAQALKDMERACREVEPQFGGYSVARAGALLEAQRKLEALKLPSPPKTEKIG